MLIKIRNAKTEDCDGILRLLTQIATIHNVGRPDIFKPNTRKYDKDEVLDILKNPGKPVFVAVDENNNLLGYAFCILLIINENKVFNEYKTLYVDDFCMDEDARGKNVGTNLLNYIKTYAKQNECANIELNVWDFNKSAVDFYRKAGFVTQRRRMEMKI